MVEDGRWNWYGEVEELTVVGPIKKDDIMEFLHNVSHPLISRVEVIGEGREFVKHDINGINLSFQDDGRTLKVFLGE